MATESKKYLDLTGLQHLLNKLDAANRIIPHPTGKAKEEGAYKIEVDANGHVIGVSDLTPSDIGAAVPGDIGEGKLTLKIGTKTVEFNANQADNDNKTFEITASDLSGLGLDGAMHFKGVVTTLPATTNYASGDVILVKDASSKNEAIKAGVEYVCANGAWHELGSEGSHALKTVKIEGDGTYITTKGGTLAGDTQLSHVTYTAKDSGVYKITVDGAGHISAAEDAAIKNSGKHTHTTTVVIPGSTYGTSVTPSTQKLSISKSGGSSDTAIKAITPETKKLVTTTITGVGTSTTKASKATAGTAVAVATTGDTVTGVAKVGSSFNYGTADRAAKATTVMTGFKNSGVAYSASYANECLTLTALTPATDGIYQAVDAGTTHSAIGCADTKGVSITSAKSNGSITPYTFTDVTVPIKATSATTVATGSLTTATTGVTVGDEMITGLGTPTTITAVTAVPTYTPALGTTSGVDVVTDVTLNHAAATTITATVAENGEHSHDFK